MPFVGRFPASGPFGNCLTQSAGCSVREVCGMVQSDSSANRKRRGVAHCGIGCLILGLVHKGLGSLTPLSPAHLESARCTASRRVSRKGTGVRGASTSQMHPILTKALSYLLGPVLPPLMFSLRLQLVSSLACLLKKHSRAERGRWGLAVCSLVWYRCVSPGLWGTTCFKPHRLCGCDRCRWRWRRWWWCYRLFNDF